MSGRRSPRPGRGRPPGPPAPGRRRGRTSRWPGSGTAAAAAPRPTCSPAATAYGGSACIRAWISVSGCPASITCCTASRVTRPNGTPVPSSTTMSGVPWRAARSCTSANVQVEWTGTAGRASRRASSRPALRRMPPHCRACVAPVQSSPAIRADHSSSVASGDPSLKNGRNTPKNRTATATNRPHQPATRVPVDRSRVRPQNSDSTTRPPSSGSPGSRLNSASRRLE